jgi:signal transduction histidine kinase
MSASSKAPPAAVARFRTRLMIAIMLVITAITALVLFLAQRGAGAAAEQAMREEFRGELQALHNAHAVRHAALVERCRSLVRKPRIHAALEDDALDLLYPSAREELRDTMEASPGVPPVADTYALRARFYRFLDRQGAVIPPPDAADVGALTPAEEAQLALPRVPAQPQLGYLAWGGPDTDGTVVETIAMPIVSDETGEVIAALVLGFEPPLQGDPREDAGIRRGIWLQGRLHLPALARPARANLEARLAATVGRREAGENRFAADLAGGPHLVFSKRLNPDSLFPPAYEVCVYPLAALRAHQRRLRWRVLGAAAGVLLLGWAASRGVAARFARPVEKLAEDSAEDRAQLRRTEDALEVINADLQRAARFSADASHQLKTPVTVLRAGLEELLARPSLDPEECRELSALIHQTYRLSNVIEDLLLLSRMDAGRLKIEFGPVNLGQLIEAALDDLGALPDELGLKVETDLPATLFVAGEKRYLALILQNLLENARKYNRPEGRLRIAARATDDAGVVLAVGNTGPTIPPAAQAHIFERFHRGSAGENVPGYGLGLNLAHELARLHGGELRLVRSADDWTEFIVRLQAAPVTAEAFS